MIGRAMIAALAGTLVASAAFAESVPQSAGRDARVVVVDYHPHDVITVRAAENVVTRLVLRPGDAIIEALSAFPEGWDTQIANERHSILIKPHAAEAADGSFVAPEPARWATNLSIETAERFYDVWLEIADAQRPAATRVVLRYPDEDRDARAAASRRELDMLAAESILPRLPAPAPGAERYRSVPVDDASRSIAPSFVYDDGTFTYLGFRGEIPAVFVIDAAGDEAIVNPDVDPRRRNVVIVDRLAPGFALRLGKLTVAVYRNGAGT